MASDRLFGRGFLVVIGLTAWLFLAGIIILPGLGPTHADAQTESVQDLVPSTAQ